MREVKTFVNHLHLIVMDLSWVRSLFVLEICWYLVLSFTSFGQMSENLTSLEEITEGKRMLFKGIKVVKLKTRKVKKF